MQSHIPPKQIWLKCLTVKQMSALCGILTLGNQKKAGKKVEQNGKRNEYYGYQFENEK